MNYFSPCPCGSKIASLFCKCVETSGCDKCGGTGREFGSGDYDHSVHMTNPATQEPCIDCNGTGETDDPIVESGLCDDPAQNV